MQLEISATSILALFDTTPEQRESFAKEIEEALANNTLNLLDHDVQLDGLEKLLGRLQTGIPYAANAAYPKNKEFEFDGDPGF